MTSESFSSDDARIDVSALFGAVLRRLPRIILITLGLLVATFIILMFQPRLYESSASILVEPRTNAYIRASNEQAPSASASDVGVVSSQIELLKSRDTLLGVIDALDLRSVPEFNGGATGFSPLGLIMRLAGRGASASSSIDETVLGALYDRLTVVQERDSRIISVLVRTTDPALSARIANAVAAAHVARRAQLSISDTADASGWLAEEIARLRVSVRDAESAVANFRVDNDLFTGQNNTSLLDQQLSTISSQITAAQERKSTAASRAELIRGLIQRNQPIEGVADVRDSVVIQRLSEEKARLQGELAQLSATLLPNHPNIRALTAQISELNNQIRVEGARVASALEAESQIESALEASLQADLARAKSSASLATRDTVTLDGLEREAKAQRDLLEAYLLRFNEASSRVDASSALPDVRVVSEAAPSVTPASPKTSLIMAAVGVISIAVQVGVVAFGELMSGRALAPVVRAPVATDRLEEAPFDEAELEPEQRWEVDSETQPALDDQFEAAMAPRQGIEGPTAPQTEGADDARTSAFDDADAEPDFRVAASERARGYIRALMAEQAERRLSAEPEYEPMVEADLAIEPDYVEVPEDGEIIASLPPEPAPSTYAEERDDVPLAEEYPPEAIEMASPKPSHLHYADLVSDLVLGRTHLLLLADHEQGQISSDLAEDLVGDALSKGLSVALIDAGTGRRTDNPGISDLSIGAASFGDVVQKSADNGFAEVTWGQGGEIERRSSRPLTLVEALGDIYEVVVVLTGPVGSRSSLDVFAELGGRIVLVADNDADFHQAEAARSMLEEAGLTRIEITAPAETIAA